MPFSIRKIGKNKYQVYNTATGEIHSKGTTKKKAEGQFRLLQGIARKEVIGLEGGINPRHLRQALAKSKLYTIEETLTGEDARKVAPLKRQLVAVYDKIASLDKELQERISIKKLQRLEEYKQKAIELEGQIKEIYDRLPDEEDLQGMGMRGGKKWNFSNRSYNPATLAYNALLNGMTENYRSDITKEGVRQDVDRNIEQVKKFAKNPNPITFAKNEAEGQFSRYGSGYPANPSDYQPRRFL